MSSQRPLKKFVLSARLSLLILVTLCCIGITIFDSSTAHAYSGPYSGPSLNWERSFGRAGTTQKLFGGDFLENETLRVSWDGTAFPSQKNGPDGNFSFSVSIPADAPIGVAHVARVVGETSGRSAEAKFYVIDPHITISPNPAQAGQTVSVVATGFAESDHESADWFYLDGKSWSVDPNGLKADPVVVGRYTGQGRIPSTIGLGAHDVELIEPGSYIDYHVTLFIANPTLALAPTSGLAGTTTTVSGSGFIPSQTGKITYDGADLVPFTIDSNGNYSLSVTIPATSQVGSHTIQAVTDLVKAQGTFSVIAPSSVTLSPSNGLAGSTTTITGSNYQPDQAVSITFDGNVLASVTATSTGTFSLPLTIPASATAGTHTINAVSTNAAYAAQATFTVLPNPTISVTPNNGPAGAAVIVNGNNFLPGQTGTLTFNTSTLGTFTVDAQGKFSASVIVPPEAVAGDQTIQAKTTTTGYTATTSFTVQGDLLILPTLDQVVSNGDGTYSAYFGYLNKNGVDVTVPVGANNSCHPNDNCGQPTVFHPGRAYKAYRVVFSGSPLVWRIGSRTATAAVN